MSTDYHLEQVDHNPFQASPIGSRTNGHELVPQDGDPFGDSESMKAVLAQIVLLEQRILAVEMMAAQSFQALQQEVAQLGGQITSLHYANEGLKEVFTRPRRIVRDDEGRPTGVVIDHDASETV